MARKRGDAAPHGEEGGVLGVGGVALQRRGAGVAVEAPANFDGSVLRCTKQPNEGMRRFARTRGLYESVLGPGHGQTSPEKGKHGGGIGDSGEQIRRPWGTNCVGRRGEW